MFFLPGPDLINSNNYNLISAFYDPLAKAIFGNELKSAGAYALQHLDIKGNRILIPGIGTASFLDVVKFGDHINPRRIVGIDLSEKMLVKAQKRIGNQDLGKLIEIRKEDFFSSHFEAPFDMIIANFFLDCLPNRQIEEFMLRSQELLKPDGRLIITDFSLKSPKGIIKRKLMIYLAYRFFKIFTRIPRLSLPDLDAIIDPNIWKEEKSVYKLNGFIRTIVLNKKSVSIL